MEKTNDPVNHPEHYQQHPSGVECVTIASGFDYLIGNCVKYLWRAGLKGKDPLGDYKKARFYLDYKIKQLEEQNGSASAGDGSPGRTSHRR